MCQQVVKYKSSQQLDFKGTVRIKALDIEVPRIAKPLWNCLLSKLSQPLIYVYKQHMLKEDASTAIISTYKKWNTEKVGQ